MATEWKKVRLGETFTVKKGQAITKRESKEGPYPVILGGREPAYFIDRFNHEGKAIVVSRSGASAGYVSFWNEPIFITDGFLIEPNNDVCYEYIYYLMKNNQSRFIGSQKGAAIPHVTPALLSDIDILLPPLETQQKIAGILSAYDDLIENNCKQIKLLEEAAHKLYKEWFVKLNFPGHENVKIVDGVPEGWKKGKVDDVVIYHDTKRKPLSSMERSKMKGDYRYYGAASVLDYVNSYLFDGTYLLLGEDGTVITTDGYPVLQYITGKFWVNNHAHVLTGKNYYSTEFIYMMFSCMKIKDIVTGAAQPKISQARLSNKEIILPCEALVRKFSDTTKPIFDKIFNSQLSILNLQSARDKLLPRLMNVDFEL